MGDALDFDFIAQSLQATPSETRRAGEVQKYRMIQPSDVWILSSPLGRHEPVENHLMWVVNEIRSKLNVLEVIAQSATVDVFCSYTSIGDGGISLSPQLLAVFPKLGIRLEISIIVLSERDEDVA